MATTGVDFVFNNLQATGFGSNSSNTKVNVLPYLTAVEPQWAQLTTGRNPGGGSYRGDTNSVQPNTTNAAVLLDDLVASAARLTYAKNGAFLVTGNGTNAVTVPLTNTLTNTNSTAGDTVFAKWNKIIIYNLSGLDNTNSASWTIAPAGTNGVSLQFTASNTTGLALTIDGSSAHMLASVNGVTVNAANAAVTLTPTATSNIALVIMGA